MKLSRRIRLAFLGALIFLPVSALAELNECEGVWTNKACDGTVIEKPTESAVNDSSSVESKEKAVLLSKKRSLLHELTMKTIRAKREFEVEYELDEIEAFCLNKESSLAECKEKIKTARTEINSEVSQAASVLQRQKANKLREDANRLQQERNDIAANNPTVVVDERRKYYIDPYGLKRRHRVGHRSGHNSGQNDGVGNTPVRFHQTGPKSNSLFKRGNHHSKTGYSRRRAAGGTTISVGGTGSVSRGSVSSGTRAGARGSIAGSSSSSITNYSTTSY